jgi:hypothetical protein
MKTNVRYAVFAVVLAVMAPLALRAQQWSRLEINAGGVVTCVIENEGVLLAGTQNGAVARSTDNGATWMAWDGGFGSVLSMAAHGGYLYAASGDNGIYRSADNGLTWVAVNDGLTGHVNTIEVLGDTLVAGMKANGMLCSINNGDSWLVPWETPYGTNPINSRSLLSFMVHDGYIYAGTDQGVYRSTSHQGIWEQVTGPSKVMTNSLAVANGVFYANTESGVYRMDVGADTLMRTRLLSSASDIAGAGSTIYAGVYGSGVWQSAASDTGKLWNRMNDGLVDMKTVAVDVVGGWLYASFADSTLWRFPLPTDPSSSVARDTMIFSTSLKVVPNFVTESATVEITLGDDTQSSFSLAVYDAIGRVVARPSLNVSIQRGSGPKGPFFIPLETADLAPGIYYCRLNAGDQEYATKFIVAR